MPNLNEQGGGVAMLIGGLLLSVALMYIFAWIDPLTKALRDFTRDTVGEYARYLQLKEKFRGRLAK